MKKEKNNPKKTIIISAVLIVIVLGVSAYFIFGHSTKRNFGGENSPNKENRGRNFQPPNETTKSEITSFFESSPSYSEAKDYCKNNPGYCMYYCQNMNPSNEICSQVMNFTQSSGGKPPQ